MRIEVLSCEIAYKPYFTNIELIHLREYKIEQTHQRALFCIKLLYERTHFRNDPIWTPTKRRLFRKFVSPTENPSWTFMEEGGAWANRHLLTDVSMKAGDRWRDHAIQFKPSLRHKKGLWCTKKTCLGTSVYNQISGAVMGNAWPGCWRLISFASW